MTLKSRTSILALVDSLIVFFSIFIGYFVIHPVSNPLENNFLIASALTIFIAHHAFATHFGLYRKVWEFATIFELLLILKAVSFSIVAVGLVQYLLLGDALLRTLSITWMLHLLLIGGSRLSWRIFLNSTPHIKSLDLKPAIIIGAGQAGRMVAKQLLDNPENGLIPVLYIDNDTKKQGYEIYGIRVANAGFESIKEIVRDNEIERIIVATPSLSRQENTDLMKHCIDTGIHTQTIPAIEDILTGKVSVTDIHDVKIEDLLGRDEVQLDMDIIADQLTGKTILVTGAGGSIGSEISRQIVSFYPKKLLLLGHGENSIYSIDMELQNNITPNIEIIPIIADVQDRERIFAIMETYKPDVVYHAAAHKHVPLMEDNPMEAVKNNIFGTKNVADAAHVSGVKNFVLVSTDKAVNPPNVMGATKRFAEMLVQNLAKRSETKFAAVRFGNVLGSRGSVIPLFKKQIAAGGPITITDSRMTRYFMTIPEASRLVIQAGTLAEGGEVFVLDMGEPVKIVDLARNLIRLSGYTELDIPIKEIGMRPGEKLYEELLNEDEIQSETIFPKIYIGKANPSAELELLLLIEKFPEMDSEEVKRFLIGLANRKNAEVEPEKLIRTSSS
ncbi:nucleoside-diphosphate sugar epimerase/dehydratase [Planococcus liqunii]|uniref:Nucleoside-diphosphate sugar epimerase/dehydratase n=1 Tax=Planococcus liqunii TaxID=3058394 RepID=A0ABT8MNT3_9BACL|nr:MULTISPECIES: nucleoside-diphosphate sugar epimerase/dehydratase [unclassified Planococcus (in: firmicutes)]MDN7226409.1 nucleoside-diphosphate sugar epimerase/dehydratase [Planococcus sp. N064]WKA50182.1 nucleoside-diphosphate sugar epimerase/dehydratase [Planococcus sp. N056]